MDAFERIFTTYQGPLYRYLLKLCRDPFLSEELTQETFFRAYLNFAGLKNRDHPFSWLCQIGKNAFYSRCREQKRETPLEEAPAPLSADPAEDLIRREEEKRAAAALETLYEPYQSVFRMAALEGFSLKQISAVYGKSESWARVTYYRARQKMIEKWEDLK